VRVTMVVEAKLQPSFPGSELLSVRSSQLSQNWKMSIYEIRLPVH
jgi:hypothetical protein